MSDASAGACAAASPAPMSGAPAPAPMSAGAPAPPRPRLSLERPAVHGLVLAFGTVFVLVAAFHGNVWFDEAYSVAIAEHSFGEIWNIGAHDVHPVLYYWLLHAVSLLTDGSVVAYRVFTAAGAVALAALGMTHLRRDFGARTGVWFSALALFAPAVAAMATQVRMYSWASFFVGLAAIYAWRIAARVRDGGSAGASPADAVPRRWWIVLFASCAAAAYLHYFAAMAAFVVCALLLAALLAHRRGHARELAAFAVGAACAVGCYAPWLVKLAGQVSWVSAGFWIAFELPESLVETAAFPLVSAGVILAWEGGYGAAVAVAVCALLAVATACWAALALAACLRAARRAGTRPRRRRERLRALARDPAACALAVVAGVVVIAVALGAVIDQTVLYYRYLYVCAGPALFAGAALLARARSGALVAATCATTAALSCASLWLLATSAYSGENGAAVAAYEEAAASVAEDGGDPLVVSADIGVASVLSVLASDVLIVYLDVYGNGAAYEAFSPMIDVVDDWSALDGTGVSSGFEGRYVLLGTTGREDAESFAAEHDSVVVSSETYPFPYQLLTFTISVLERTG